MRKTYKYLLFIIIAFFLALFIPNIIINKSAKGSSYNDINQIEYNRVGLILGTSKYSMNGDINLYYKYRIVAAIDLYESKKIDFILISGDNGQVEYNEPKIIRADLIKAGIPEEHIFLDYAGFRTWDSIIRAKKVFGENKLTVISQKFHNQRAIFIGKQNDMELIGFNAKDVPNNYGAKTRLREKFARTKLMLDILINKQPKYLGDSIQIK
ncbi:MAG: YdcF family protein [Salinivirgaceae bacterium]|nr:YdcF family protein [Salinivirgaceae bacterium]